MTDPRRLIERGQRLAAERRFADAAEAFGRVVDMAPTLAQVRVLLGAALVGDDRPQQALPHLEAAVEQLPDLTVAHTNLGAAYQALNDVPRALACFDAAITVQPDDPLAHFNRAVAWLTAGDHARGWPELEWRWRCPQFFGRSLADDPRRWDGSPLDGRTLLIYTEQGFGDAIQMLRFAPAIRTDGRVVVRCGPTLAPLLREAGVADAIVTERDPAPAFDVHAAVMSLPALVGVEGEPIPGAVPYLSADAERRRRWEAALERFPGLRVGVCWQGDPANPKDAQRSIAPGCLVSLADEPSIAPLALQHDAEHPSFVPLRSVFDQPFDLAEAAAAIAALDLVVTVDTVTAHLAGAIGTPVWVLLAYSPDWRWMLDRTDSPWYPTARLFRQSRRGDWQTVVERVADALRRHPPPRGGC